MILYQLKCRRGHAFEAWFRDGAGYDSQIAAGAVTCPYCGSEKVAKAPMAPHLARGRAERPEGARAEGATDERRAKRVAEKILEAVGGLREHVEETCDYVGDEFASEARRIHYGEAEERDIYGEATDDEAEALDEEGIEYFRLPYLRRRND